MNNVKCVVFFPIRDETFLAEIRPNNDTDPGRMMLPAGHVESGEKLEEALIRECKEELDILPVEYTLVHRNTRNMQDEVQDCYFYAITKWSGEVKQKDVGQLKWMSFSDENNLYLESSRTAVANIHKKIHEHIIK